MDFNLSSVELVDRNAAVDQIAAAEQSAALDQNVEPGQNPTPSQKSDLRERYEHEVSQIRDRFGTLEQMRTKLGLTKRRMAEYLLVDPSAWTRWTQDGDENAPLHVYKTMSFLMAQFEKDPQVFRQAGPATDLEQLKKLEFRMRLELNDRTEAIDKTMLQTQAHVLSQVDKLKTEIAKKETLSLGWKFLLIVNLILVLYVLIR